MATRESRDHVRRRIHFRIRRRISGTGERPRLVVFRSNKHIYAQLIDDTLGRTLASAASTEEETKTGGSGGGNVEAAKRVGRLIAERGKEKGFGSVLFDRGGYLYYGRVRALAESARESGLKF